MALNIEHLESRVVLDAGLGNALEPANGAELERFSSFDSAEQLQSYLIEQSVQQWSHSFGQPTWGPSNCFGPFFRGGIADFGLAAPEAAPADAAAGGHSETNTQVEGVDEGDIVETDGKHLYVLSNNELVIIDVQTPDEPSVVSRTEFSDGAWPSSIYLHDDGRLTVLSSSYHYYGGPFIEPGLVDGIAAFDVAFPCGEPSQAQVVATVLDVNDPTNPQQVQRNEIDGSLVDSRVIDDQIYLVLRDGILVPGPEVIPLEDAKEPVEIEGDEEELLRIGRPIVFESHTHVYETEEQYRTRLEQANLEDWLPGYQGLGSEGEVQTSGLVSEATDIVASKHDQLQSMMSVVVLDASSDTAGIADSVSLLDNGGYQIYMSTENLYVFNSVWSPRGEETTEILKFDLDDGEGNIEVDAEGEVKGRALNRFSLDEYQDHLRIATTTGRGEQTRNQVYVLTQIGDSLEVAGSIDYIAPGETIQSARFMGDRGYIVTFRRVDPLFSMDLSDPADPRIEGELKIPGFSAYLQSISENHLLGVGYDADEETGRTEALQVSLFDVSNPVKPDQVDVYIFPGGNSTSTEAIYDPHAISYFPDEGILALPVQSWNVGWFEEELSDFVDIELPPDGELEPDEKPFIRPQSMQGLFVFSVDPDTGFDLNGVVEHPSQVRRSVRIGDLLFSLSYDTLKVTGLADPEREVASLNFQNGTLNTGRPTDTNPGEIRENTIPEFVAGDANQDGQFNQLDIINILQTGKYLTGKDADWSDGDFDGNGVFNQLDIIAALQTGNYLDELGDASDDVTKDDRLPEDEVFADLQT